MAPGLSLCAPQRLRGEAVPGQETVRPPTGHREPQVNPWESDEKSEVSPSSTGKWLSTAVYDCKRGQSWIILLIWERRHTQPKEASGSPENCPRSQSVPGHVTERRKNTALQLEEDER